MEQKHTPGPWSIHHDVSSLDGHVLIDSSKHGALAQVVWKMEDDERTPECEANARLIAAAPELLEVAQSILVDDMIQYLPVEYVSNVKTIIAKATGK